MKLYKYFILLVLFSCSNDIQIKEINNWSVKHNNDYIPATVPGNIFIDLLSNKIIPDPFMLNNEDSVQWVHEKIWEYSSFFNVSNKILKQDEQMIKLKGLDTYATVYLNVSAHTIMHPEFCSIFTDFVEKHKLKPNQFGLEVTETAELADINVASDSLNILKKKGIKIALDDFGAGYASLKYVRDLPIDVVKLDKHFTFNVSDPSTARLISFVSEVCEDLQLEMIGEGIETEEDKNMMIDLGCKIGQGYLMHRPNFLDSFKSKDN